MKNFIIKLQKSDDSTKKRWLIIFSGIAGFLVVIFWIFYLNWTVLSVNGPAGKFVDNQSNFFNVFLAGLSVVAKRTVSGLTNSYVYFNDKARTRNKFIINRGGHSFIYKGLDRPLLRKLP